MNLGFIGLGGYSRNHQRAVEKNDGLKLVSAYDPVGERLDAAAGKFGAKRAGSAEEVAADPEVEGVVITTPNAMHFEHFKVCAGEGKHVFVNVPVVTDPEEAREMLRLAEARRIVLMAGHNLRRNPAIVRMKEILRGGELGAVHSAEATVTGASGYDLTPENWRYFKKTAPLLPFTQMGVVFIDLVLDFMGTPETISAFMAKRDGAGDAPDLGVVTAQYADGRMSYIGCSYVSYSGYEIAFIGNEGKAKWDNRDDNSVTLHRSDGLEREAFERIDEQYEELAEFSACAQVGGTPSVGGVDAYNVAEYFACVRRSVETGQAVRFRKYGGGGSV